MGRTAIATRRHSGRMVALGLFLLVAAAAVSPPAASQAMLGSEEAACKTYDWVFIAKVTDRKLIFKPYGASPRTAFLKLDLDVEGVAHGDIPPRLTEIALADDMELGERPVGARILFLWGFLTGDRKRPQSHHAEVLYYLDPKAQLPDERTLRAIWDEHCKPSNLANTLQGHPTLPYLDMLPDGFKRWCEHY